jgi:hypothetical protein
MASKICVQSSVAAHPQSGFNNWINLLHSQLKPKLVLRQPTDEEFTYVREHLEIFKQLFTDQDLVKIVRGHKTETHHMNMGLNHMKIELFTFYDDDPDTRRHYRVYFKASIVRLDRNGDESQITNEVYQTHRKIYQF